jgi:hypothetical protein
MIVVGADDHADARLVVPPQFRDKARVTLLRRFAWTGGDEPHAAEPGASTVTKPSPFVCRPDNSAIDAQRASHRRGGDEAPRDLV